MQEYFESLSDTHLWILGQCPKNKKKTPKIWVFKVNNKLDGSFANYKACYVAKGSKQTKSVDYFEAFDPTSQPETFKPNLSLAAKEKFMLRKTDVKST